MNKYFLFAIFRSFIIYLAYLSSVASNAQNLVSQIDSILNAKHPQPFNGVVLLCENRKTTFLTAKGLSDLKKNIILKTDDQFVIGSLTKQFTAVLILLQYQKGKLNIKSPIKKYLPELTQPWADTVTIEQLLLHTHGIKTLNKPLLFKPGTQFLYSQLGYHLLGSILEETSKKSFATLSSELFKKYGMIHTFHPAWKSQHKLIKGYTISAEGKPNYSDGSLDNFPAAGSFISTAGDLLIWNKALHEGKILNDSIYKKMIAPQENAVRDHPFFGKTDYGYGITTGINEGLLQLGQTGFATGFVCMNFYFPQSKTSIIVLENMVYDEIDLKKAFYHHREILRLVRHKYKNK